MDYRNYNGTYYIKIDKGEEVIKAIVDLCKKEGIKSAIYSGIGGCKKAEIQTFIPENGSFETRELSGMLELVSFNGNIICDDAGELYHHTHALFSFKKDGVHATAGGHLKSVTVLYTAEIELRPVVGGTIKYKKDEETGTGFWDFCD